MAVVYRWPDFRMPDVLRPRIRRMSPACRSGTRGIGRALEDDDWRMSHRYTLGPAFSRDLKGSQVPESPRKGCSMGLPRRPQQAAWGVHFTAGPGRWESRLALNFRWGNRRRRTRRRGAAAALERRGVPTLPSDEVSSEVQAGSAGAPARAGRAVRRHRCSGWSIHAKHGATACDAEAPDRGPGQASRRAKRCRERGAKRAR